MRQLSYQTLKEIGSQDFVLPSAPERILQFGEGNFLRGFVDYFFDIANERAGFNGKVVVVQPVSGALQERFAAQDCLYTLYLRGIEDGKPLERRRLISCISRCIDAATQFDAVLACACNPDLRFIVSNTTEAGIVFRAEDRYDNACRAAFPGKLTRFLHERFLRMGETHAPGFILLPCELIDFNGVALLDCVLRYATLWQLDNRFVEWLQAANTFCNTLVDRIVPGYPQNAATFHAQNGYEDQLMNTCELFGFWAIEGDPAIGDTLPFQQIGLPVLVTPDYAPYKRRKVCILNGAHTSMTCAALQCGLETVEQCMQDIDIRQFIKSAIYDEIIPTLDLPQDVLLEFAKNVLERFQNPFIRHELMSITLNTTSKWRARVLPSILAYRERFGRLPALLTFGFAANIEFLRCGRFDAKDDANVLTFYAKHSGASLPEFVHALCARDDFWGMDLSELPGFETEVLRTIQAIETCGMRNALSMLLRTTA